MNPLVSMMNKFRNAMPKAPEGKVPYSVLVIRYIIKLLLLFLVLFIFVIWPVVPVHEYYNPISFDEWSNRMKELPENVWYILFTIIIGWGTSSIFSRKEDHTKKPEPMEISYDDIKYDVRDQGEE